MFTTTLMNRMIQRPEAFRYGFTFIPQDLIYREELAEPLAHLLNQLKCAWVLIESPRSRAIPEEFIKTLSAYGIQIIIDLNLPANELFNNSEYDALIKAYGHWGAKYVLASRYPNERRNTSDSFWAKTDPLSFAVANFIKLARACIGNSIKPIFPLLMPGGSYWDTAFLENALTILATEENKAIIDQMVISACGWTFGRDLDWGTGGKARWSNTKPYSSIAGEEDQKGFRCVEWYQEISLKILGKKLPCLVLDAGLENHIPEDASADQFIKIARLSAGENVEKNVGQHEMYVPLSQDTIGCLLGFNLNRFFARKSVAGSPEEALERVLYQWIEQNDEITKSSNQINQDNHVDTSSGLNKRVILLPEKESLRDVSWKKALDQYLHRYPARVIYSTAEARRSVHVLALGDENQFTEESLEELRTFGAHVRRVLPQHILKANHNYYAT